MSLESLLNKTCDVERPTVTKDNSGGSVRSFTSVATGVSCAIQPLKSQERRAYAQRMIYVTHRFYFAADPGVRRGDRLKDAGGNFFIVVGYENQAGRDRLFSVDCKEQT